MAKLSMALFCALITTPTLSLAGGFSEHGSNNNPTIGTSSRPDDHAPISVMGDHMHRTGEFMISVRHMRMEMAGNKNGTRTLDDNSVLAIANTNGGMFTNLRAVPQKMTMTMTMLGAMYAPSNEVTLMLGTSYRANKMTARSYNMMGNLNGAFTTKSEGFGDTTLSALIKITDTLHTGIGVSLPTGSIKKSDVILTPMNTRLKARLPYAMQLGSGTYDLKPSLTYNNKSDKMSFGFQIGGIFRLEDNRQAYTRGDEQYAKFWGARPLSQNISLSGLISASHADSISGKDAAINTPIQSAQASFYGGDRVQLSIGVNWIGSKGLLSGHRLGLEISQPIYENLNGPQMSLETQIMIGYQNAF